MSTKKFKYKDHIYTYQGVGRYKDSTGEWVDAAIYSRDNHIYMREILDFFEKFEKIQGS